MALKSQSMFLYGYDVTNLSCNMDFVAVSGGPTLTATLSLGQYSLTTLLDEIVSALTIADPAHIYTAVADRTLMGGTQNRVTIGTNSSFFSILFASGPNIHTSIAPIIGFNPTDYTGLTAYTGASSTGNALIPDFIGYSYNQSQQKVFGAVNVSASGLKESVVFNFQNFLDVEFKYETLANVQTIWANFWAWAIQQRPYDFTPEITSPTTFFNVTLEKTDYDGKGLGYMMKEMLPDFPNLYQTGNINMRITPDILATQFIL